MDKAPEYVLFRLKSFARAYNFKVTSGSGDSHNTGSLHPLNRAIDVRTRDKTEAQVATFKRACKAANYRVLDERTRPPGQQVWGGPHLHVEDRGNYPPA